MQLNNHGIVQWCGRSYSYFVLLLLFINCFFYHYWCEKTWRCTNSMPVQNPFYVYVYVQYVCKFELFTVPGCRMSDSGKSSKLDVSSMLLMSMEIAAGLSLGEGKQYNFSYQLQTMVLYDHAHKRLDYINIAKIKNVFVLFINSYFAVLMTQGTQKKCVCRSTWYAPSPQTQRTGEIWFHPHFLIQSCFLHLRNTWKHSQTVWSDQISNDLK